MSSVSVPNLQFSFARWKLFHMLKSRIYWWLCEAFWSFICGSWWAMVEFRLASMFHFRQDSLVTFNGASFVWSFCATMDICQIFPSIWQTKNLGQSLHWSKCHCFEIQDMFWRGKILVRSLQGFLCFTLFRNKWWEQWNTQKIPY